MLRPRQQHLYRPTPPSRPTNPVPARPQLFQPETSTKRITVSVLCRPAIVGADPRRSPRVKSLELLFYLAGALSDYRDCGADGEPPVVHVDNPERHNQMTSVT